MHGRYIVKDIEKDSIDLTMVKSINDIGKVMGKKTIAEFVERAGILSKLLEIGVDYAQGVFIGKPYSPGQSSASNGPQSHIRSVKN